MAKTNRYKHIVLDFDGTICDLNVNWLGLKKELFTHFGEKYHFTSASLMEMVNTVFRANIPNDRKIALDIISAFEQPDQRVIYTNPNEALLSDISHFYVVSNNLSSTIIKVLRDLNLLKNCKCIVGIDNVLESKPSPVPFQKILSTTKDESPSDYLYIGDSETDRLFALNCGIEFINVTETAKWKTELKNLIA